MFKKFGNSFFWIQHVQIRLEHISKHFYQKMPSQVTFIGFPVSLYVGSWCMWAAVGCGQLLDVGSWCMWVAGVCGWLVYLGGWCMWAASGRGSWCIWAAGVCGKLVDVVLYAVYTLWYSLLYSECIVNYNLNICARV